MHSTASWLRISAPMAFPSTALFSCGSPLFPLDFDGASWLCFSAQKALLWTSTRKCIIGITISIIKFVYIVRDPELLLHVLMAHCICHNCCACFLLSDAEHTCPSSDSWLYSCPRFLSATALSLKAKANATTINRTSETYATVAAIPSLALLSISVVVDSTAVITLRSLKTLNRLWLTSEAQGSALSLCAQATLKKKGLDNIHE